MILGSQARKRPTVELVESGVDADHSDQLRPDARDHRDRGNFLSPRLYPSAPFEPWQPVACYVPQPAEQPEAEQPDAEIYA